MPVAPTPAPHTPVLFVLAGGMGFFNAACVKALAKAGYKPDDFGTHEEVQAKIKEAKAARTKYEDDARSKGAPLDPHQPDPHTAMLARCQSGHLTQDALFHAPGAANRGNACANNQPPESQADSRLYVSSQAPCMPMQTHSGPDGGNSIGSPHWAVGGNESAQRQANPNVVSPETMKANSTANVQLALRENPDAAAAYDDKISKIDKSQKASQAQRQADAAARRDLAAAGQQASAAELQGKGGTGDNSGSQSDSDTKASDCIEAFREAMMEEMRRKALEKYGKDYDKTKDQAQSKFDAADTRAKAAKDKYDDLKAQRDAETDPDKKAALDEQRKAAGKEIGQAMIERGAAKKDLANVDCLNAQARSITGQPNPPQNGAFEPPGGALPPLTGFNPS